MKDLGIMMTNIRAHTTNICLCKTKKHNIYVTDDASNKISVTQITTNIPVKHF